ncbi:MAG: DUF721 domain-containing protein [Planctomycetales bacterium]|nr:DUF721 domain-containing protein [Planctomycetales bacterium]NIM07888.1 DUF721 domain-containing protein [Planctomycetales bacterium]NIN09028.1 DUF721 domain-containing protein [Planctomycetales bacterium]NIN78141.1 DUF721 domain-containing protein [Planctomycetales bacterium]NIO33669.1 DUF721 domain-containing protein [Planctomycetales bacterium]
MASTMKPTAAAGRNRRKPTARGLQPIGNVVSELMTRHGIGRQLAARQREEAWQQAVGQRWAAHTRCGSIYRRRLEVIVASSTLMQELTFQKQEILQRLRENAPELLIEDIRFKLGAVS